MRESHHGLGDRLNQCGLVGGLSDLEHDDGRLHGGEVRPGAPGVQVEAGGKRRLAAHQGKRGPAQDAAAVDGYQVPSDLRHMAEPRRCGAGSGQA